jgi:two-component system sensor histidine kinase UhpB
MSRATPPDLHRLVMGRVAPVAMVMLAVAMVMGVWKAGRDVDEEVRAAMALASVVAHLSARSSTSDSMLVGELQRIVRERPLRHVTLTLHDARGRVRVEPGPQEPLAGPDAWLHERLGRLWPGAAPAPVQWPLPRPDGTRWSVTLAATPENERREAFGDLGGIAMVLIVGVATMLAVTDWSVRRGLAPMNSLLGAIKRIRSGELRAADSLPRTRVRELQAVGDALRGLGTALEAAEADRRALSRKILTLQEDERSFIARELHDELGQELTVTRIDAAVLQRGLSDNPELKTVVDAIAERMARMQLGLRSVLSRLVPRDTADIGERALHEMLSELAAGWRRSAEGWLEVQVDVDLGPQGRPLPAPLVLALYRMSQEALTNAARHSSARHVALGVRASGDTVEWQACDDGVGLEDLGAALHRGSGLAGIRERAWAFGGDLQCSAARAGHDRPGLCLRARLTIPAPAGETA